MNMKNSASYHRRAAQLHRAADGLSVATSTYCDGKFEGRHVDLRPVHSVGQKFNSFPAASRAWRSQGSLSVNSSQGGAAKTPGFYIDAFACANSLCGMARYIERAENIARIVT